MTYRRHPALHDIDSTLPEHYVIDRLCMAQHEAYERAAIEVGWETQERSRVPWADLPFANKQVMRKSMKAVLDELQLLGES